MVNGRNSIMREKEERAHELQRQNSKNGPTGTRKQEISKETGKLSHTVKHSM